MERPMTNTPSLKSLVERINRLEDEKQETADAIKEVYLEAKSNGFDVKALRIVIREQRRPPDKAVVDMVDLYKSKLGMLADTPLGKAAIASVSAPFHAPADDNLRVAEPT